MLSANPRRPAQVEERIGAFIKDVGFPIAVAVYLLLSLNPKVDRALVLLDRLVQQNATLIQRGAR